MVCKVFGVALHPEGVDRNKILLSCNYGSYVALHPEGVDRNLKNNWACAMPEPVALHPEGVDRNKILGTDVHTGVCRPPPGGRG